MLLRGPAIAPGRLKTAPAPPCPAPPAQRDPRLKQILDSIPVRKYVFTNADRRHAERCLQLLGITDCFEVRGRAEGRGRVQSRLAAPAIALVKCSAVPSGGDAGEGAGAAPPHFQQG